MRQFLVERTMLAAAGCAGGYCLRTHSHARAGSRRAAEHSAIGTSVTVDWTVFGMAAAVATLTGLGFGLAPALAGIAHIARRESEVFGTEGRHTLRRHGGAAC